jgi:HPt (histidine-containing phosphotransfer) domain-containing protein
MSVTNFTPTECSPTLSPRVNEIPASEFQDLLSVPPIDGAQFFERFLGILDIALPLLDEFVTTSPSHLEAFDTAMAERNHAAISEKAHGLKGVAGIMAAGGLMEICSKLESAAKDADWNQTRGLIQQLHLEMQRAIDFIPSLRPLA